MSEEYEPGLVSVIIPTYNRAHFIVEAMDSVFAQTYRPIELIVVDDGSTDNTRDVLEQWKASHGHDGQFTIRYFFQENKGAPAARNLGLIESCGEFIQFLDSDDILEPSKVAVQTSYLKQHSTVDFVYSSTSWFESMPDQNSVPFTGFPMTDPLLGFLRGLPWVTPSGVYRRGLCITIGYWNEDLSSWQDWEYHCRLCLATENVKFIAGIRSFARCGHGDRITKNACSITWVRSGATALRRVHALVDRHLVNTTGQNEALAIGFVNMARRAAWVGDTALYQEMIAGAYEHSRAFRSYIAAFIVHTFSCILGLEAAGALFEWATEKTCGLRRLLRFRRSMKMCGH
jgi:glycosyltransferase involved in cell wall biosynthesis